jgi:Skp family chaperone for outer membrane proteins
MKLRLILLSVIAAGSFAAAQANADTIAIINYQKILHESSAGKSVKEQLDAKEKTFQSEMSKKEDELNKEQEKLSQQRAVLSPDAFEKKAKEFRAKTNAAQREVQSKKGALDNALFSASNDIQKAVGDIVANMAKSKGYTMVIPVSQLLYADAKLDITNEVLTQLNSTLPKVTLNFNAAAASGKGDEQ